MKDVDLFKQQLIVLLSIAFDNFIYTNCLINNRTTVLYLLTLSPPSTTKKPYANRLDPDDTQSNSASHPD